MTDEAADARKLFEEIEEYEQDFWREEGLADLRFVKLREQWPDEAIAARGDGRPMLTIDKLGPAMRQVVNDARQNKPAILARPAGPGADKATSDILSGLIRNIEYVSDADIAYDTAVESAVGGAVGYIRVNITDDGPDPFERDLAIERVADASTVYGDPDSERADSSDWNVCFVRKMIPKSRFEREYPNAEHSDWESESYRSLSDTWVTKNNVAVVEHWEREKAQKLAYMLSNGTTVYEDEIEDQAAMFAEQGIEIVGSPKPVTFYKVTQKIRTGLEVLEENEWPGQYIPIIPVYGEEFTVDGKRYARSMFNGSKDAQRNFNYWRSTTTELIALAPKVPYIGQQGAFDVDDGWSTANTENHPYLEYAKGYERPTREQYAPIPAGAMQEALNASDDIKTITGIHDASLGARSNETSGRAIRARQMEGDTSTFNFIDNLTRGIRHTGRILLDLIPKVYNADRIIRILGPDMEPQEVRISPDAQALQAENELQARQQFAVDNGRAPEPSELEQLQADIPRIYDIWTGKYDLTVKAGPSYTTLREETRSELVELMRAAGSPEERQAIGKLYLKNSDWPGAEELLEEFEDDGIPPQLQQQIDEGMARMQELEEENSKLKNEYVVKMKELELQEVELGFRADELVIKKLEAQAKLLDAQNQQAQFVGPEPQSYAM